MFIVPKYLVNDDGSLGERNKVAIAGLNHKMGQRGITNTVLNFDGAVGYLVGEPHQGIRYMFTMMNEARLGVGMGAVALGYTGYLKSLQYARERPQGRPLTAKDPTTPQVPIIEHADVKRMLLAQKAYVEGGLGLLLYCAKLVDLQHSAESDEERDAVTLLLDILTPIGKSWPSQWCTEANSLAIQVHGGYGYTREYDVEQHYRDNRLNPIHEGTHGIQSLDLLGRKVTQRGGVSLAALGAAIAATVEAATAEGGDAAELAESLSATWQRLVDVTTAMFASGDIGPRSPTAWCTSRRSATSSSRGSGWSRWWLAPVAPEISTTANARRRGTSSAANCPRPDRSSICWRRWTARRWKCATPGSEPPCAGSHTCLIMRGEREAGPRYASNT